MKRFFLLCSLVTVAFAQTPPYDQLRPVWPLTWDTSLYESITDVKVGKPDAITPAAYEANAVIPDTMDQAYLDALNMRISPIRVNQAGYRPSDKKLIYYVGTATDFEVVDSAGTTVYGTGTFSSTGTTTQSSYAVVASNNAQTVNNGDTRYTTGTATGPSGTLMAGYLPDGLPENTRLRVRVGSDYSATFIISDEVYSMVRDATLKFFGVNRSGSSESWFHPASHTLDGSVDGTAGSLAGGWYDCGDHLKEGLTQSYAFMALAIMAATQQDRDEDHYAYDQSETDNTDGVPDMMREARHGAEFFLKAYARANGSVADMPISVGDYGKDHSWWERPEYQDYTIEDRGGPTSRTPRLELWSTTGGEIATGLALLSKLYETRDSSFADSALSVAKLLYEYGKADTSKGSSSAYSGNDSYDEDLANACVALLWATGDTSYLYDLAENPALPGRVGSQSKADFSSNNGGAGTFDGGWFTYKQASFFKDVKNTSWANSYTFALYSFYKLILSSESIASGFGIDNTRRLTYAEDVAYTMAANLGDVSNGSSSITLPTGAALWKSYKAGYDPIWFSMNTDQTWIYNRYQAGNIFDVLAYADVTKDLEGVVLPQNGKQTWNSDAMFELGENQMNYMLGLNPWDMSMLYGVGDKNYPHPHHRASNPEGKNVPGAIYSYLPPVGGLFGNMKPGDTNALKPYNTTTSWADYYVAEVCLDASATVLCPEVLLAKDEDLNRAPDISVEIKYVGYDSAIVIVKQTFYGSASINYGTSTSTMTTVASDTQDTVVHTIVLRDLTGGTTYYFYATATNANSGNSGTRYLVDSTETPYTFTTLSNPAASADIQNVKVCNVSADSAEIMWYTPNGQYDSKIYWDTVLTSYDKMQWSQEGDVSGVPTKFHYVKIGGLKERTTYYFAVESNGSVRAVDDDGLPLKFTTPVEQHDFEVRAYKYDEGGLPFVNLNIYNNDSVAYDSLELRLYFRAADSVYDLVGTRADICQAYDEAGFNKSCSDSTINALNEVLSLQRPIKLDDTYRASDKTYEWYFPITLGNTNIKSASRFRIDVRFDTRSSYYPYTDLMNQRPSIVPGEGSDDWSWMVHSKADGDPEDFVGILTEDKDYGDSYMADVDYYITVYRKDQFVWGYSPSYTEQSTKVSNYEITTTLESPFNVSNGTYVELDAASSTVHVKGTASITEDGEITSIWVNGSELSSLDGVATYNSTTGLWDLDIPVKLTIGANTIDITIFAGPDTDCEECQENGGCAFVNHNFYIQFSKGDATASTLSIIDASTGAAVTSPATPGSTEFSIQVRDLDKIKSGASTVTALVINSRLLDTLEVTLTLGADSVFRSSADISAVSKKGSALGNNEVSFFGGDTIVVRYIDPDDEDDVSEQSFYAESSYPTLAGAEAVDSDCDGVMDLVRVYLSSSLDEGISASRASLIVNDLNTDVSDTVSVSSTGFTISNDTLSIPVSSYDLTAEGAISGSVSVTFLNSDAESATQSSLLTDRVEPHLISVTILEKETTDESENDTIRLGFSESVTLSPTGWPLDLTTQAGGSVDVSGLSLISEAAKNSGKSWQIVLAANTVVDTGLLASIASAYTVTDVAGNILGSGCAKDTVEITESPRPVPIEFAIMRDTDNDGDPDLLYMQFKSSLTSKNILDSFVVQWGGEIKSFTQYTPVDGDSSQWTITVADLYELGATSGPYSGMGGVTPRLGASGAFFDSTYMIQDSVGPILLSASKASMSSGIDSLGIVVSEPVDTVSGVYMLERKRGDKVVVLVPEACSSIRSSDSLFVFYYNDDSQGAVRAGDSVRLVSANPGVKDMAGNAPPAYAPWIVVEGKLSPEVEYAVSMVSSVSGQNASQGYISDNPDEGDDFRVTLLSGGNELKIAEGSSTLTTNMAEQPYDSTYQHVGPTFQVDLQLPSGSLLQDNTYVWYYSVSVRLKIFDNLGQFVNAVNYKFSIDDIGRDYLSSGGSITMYFEWLSHDGVGPLAQSGRHVGSGAYIGAFDFSSVAIAQVSDADSDGDGELEYTKGDKIESDATKRRVFGVMRK